MCVRSFFVLTISLVTSEPGTLPRFQGHQTRADGSLVPETGDAIGFRVTNLTGIPLHIAAFLISTDGSFSQLYPPSELAFERNGQESSGECEVLGHGATLYGGPERLYVPKNQVRLLGEGEEHQDILVVYATTLQTSYKELIDLAGVQTTAQRSTLRGYGDDQLLSAGKFMPFLAQANPIFRLGEGRAMRSGAAAVRWAVLQRPFITLPHGG